MKNPFVPFALAAKQAAFVCRRFVNYRLKYYALGLLIVTGASCGDDNEGPSVFINTGATEVSYVDVNTCDIGGGVYYTEYFLTIPYTASPNLEIEKILYSTVAQGTTPTSEKEKTTFEDTGTEINFSLCFKFGSASALEFTSTLVSKDGVKSSHRTYIIIRPSGAN